jgi:hypothetical protein
MILGMNEYWRNEEIFRFTGNKFVAFDWFDYLIALSMMQTSPIGTVLNAENALGDLTKGMPLKFSQVYPPIVLCNILRRV